MKRILLLIVCIALIFQLCPMLTLAELEQEYITEVVKPQYFNSGNAISTVALSDNVDELRSVLFEGFYNCQSRIDISSFGLEPIQNNVDALSDLIYYEMAECFHVSGFSYSYTSSKIVAIVPAYSYTKAEYQNMYADFIAVRDQILQGIKGNSNLDDVQKALLLHDRLAMICQYDYGFTNSDIIYTAYGAMVNGSAVCQGYTEAYDYLLNEVGIRSEFCRSNQLNHIWNIVYINDTPYHVDVTWDDIAWRSGSRGAVGVVWHNNFLRSSNGIYSTGHDSNDYDTTPTSTTYDNYFWQNSESAFQLIGSELYYIDYQTSQLKRYSDKKVLCSVYDRWGDAYGYWNNQARLSGDGRYLYYSSTDAVYQYNIIQNTSSVVFEPDLSGYNSIYGFVYEDGYFVCDISDAAPCSYSETVLYQVKQAYVAPSVGSVDSWNISLDGNINMNLYLSVDQNAISTAKVNTVVDGETTSKNVSGLEKIDGLYKLTIELPAAQMNETVAVQVVNDGECSQVYTYSVRQYCDIILQDNTQSAYHSLVREMLNYGAMAQVYFSYKTSSLANVGISGTASNAVPTSTTALKVTGELNGCTFYGASLVYENQIAIRLYFVGNVSNITFTVNGKTYKPVANNGMYYVEVADILPQNLSQQISVFGKDSQGNTLTVVYSPLNYIVRMNQSGNTNTKNLMKALYNYYLAADKLF